MRREDGGGVWGLSCGVFSGTGNRFNPWKSRVAERRNAANRLDAELARQSDERGQSAGFMSRREEAHSSSIKTGTLTSSPATMEMRKSFLDGRSRLQAGTERKEFVVALKGFRSGASS